MLETLIFILPAMLAVVAYHFLHAEIDLKKNKTKILLPMAVYTVVSNILILCGLHWIGMESFNLFDMSIRFKLKWLGLELGFGSVLTILWGGGLNILHAINSLF